MLVAMATDDSNSQADSLKEIHSKLIADLHSDLQQRAEQHADLAEDLARYGLNVNKGSIYLSYKVPQSFLSLCS